MMDSLMENFQQAFTAQNTESGNKLVHSTIKFRDWGKTFFVKKSVCGVAESRNSSSDQNIGVQLRQAYSAAPQWIRWVFPLAETCTWSAGLQWCHAPLRRGNFGPGQ